MPEGPSIVILREEVAAFAGRTIERAEGSAKIDMSRLAGQVVRSFHSWGKHFLIELDDVSVRIHLLLFGSYRINERKDAVARLSLGFANGELNFYACSVQLIEGALDATYDWSMDLMSDAWSPRATLKRLRERPQLLACDALLDQTLFAGSVRVEGERADARYYNAIVAIGDDGEIIDAADKIWLVPFGEFMPLADLLSRIGVEKLVRSVSAPHQKAVPASARRKIKIIITLRRAFCCCLR